VSGDLLEKSGPRDSMQDAQSPIGFLRSPQAIRARANEMLELGLAGKLDHFEVRLESLGAVVDRTERVTRQRYPSLEIPPHGRMGHFRVGGTDRTLDLDKRIASLDPAEQARVRFALVVTSVLLDAGAGDGWRYREPGSGAVFSRSEGLAVASYHQFISGLFSSDPKSPLRADADGLDRLDSTRLGAAFQAGSHNPLVGLEGRTELLATLGSAMRAAPHFFGDSPPRVGRLYDAIAQKAEGKVLPARRILHTVLEALSPIWPGRIVLLGVNLGDVWSHPKIGGSGPTAGLVPFHKLSQWLTYSLLEPLGAAGIEVVGVDELTGLAEYRNGGLFVDGDVLVPKHEAVTRVSHAPGSEIIVEWRALTIALLDRVAAELRTRFGMDAATLPVARVLEGGTWAAGREIALEKRAGGGPPISIASDGTVF
jgi:hypothetical protein